MPKVKLNLEKHKCKFNGTVIPNGNILKNTSDGFYPIVGSLQELEKYTNDFSSKELSSLNFAGLAVKNNHQPMDWGNIKNPDYYIGKIDSFSRSKNGALSVSASILPTTGHPTRDNLKREVYEALVSNEIKDLSSGHTCKFEYDKQNKLLTCTKELFEVSLTSDGARPESFLSDVEFTAMDVDVAKNLEKEQYKQFNTTSCTTKVRLGPGTHELQEAFAKNDFTKLVAASTSTINNNTLFYKNSIRIIGSTPEKMGEDTTNTQWREKYEALLQQSKAVEEERNNLRISKAQEELTGLQTVLEKCSKKIECAVNPSNKTPEELDEPTRNTLAHFAQMSDGLVKNYSTVLEANLAGKSVSTTDALDNMKNAVEFIDTTVRVMSKNPHSRTQPTDQSPAAAVPQANQQSTAAAAPPPPATTKDTAQQPLLPPQPSGPFNTGIKVNSILAKYVKPQKSQQQSNQKQPEIVLNQPQQASAPQPQETTTKRKEPDETSINPADTAVKVNSTQARDFFGTNAAIINNKRLKAEDRNGVDDDDDDDDLQFGQSYFRKRWSEGSKASTNNAINRMTNSNATGL